MNRKFIRIWDQKVLPGLHVAEGWIRLELHDARAWAGLGVAVVLGALLLSSCGDPADEPMTRVRQPTSGHTPVAPASAVVLVAPIQEQDSAGIASSGPATITAYRVLLPECEAIDPYEGILTLRDQIRRDAEDLFQRLARQLPPVDAAYLAGLRRIHSPEQFLRELASWLQEADNADLVSAEHQNDLHQLQQQCARCEQRIAGLPKIPQPFHP